MVKGLREYVEKHGMHFTMKLAEDVLGKEKRRSLEEIRKLMDKEAWYNVTGATDGDLLYLGNCFMSSNKRKDTALVISLVSSYHNNQGFSFRHFLLGLMLKCFEDFDFTPYI